MSGSIDLRGWVPALARAAGGSLELSLFKAGPRRFTEPFFDDTLRSCLTHPFHAVFMRRVGVSQAEHWLRDHPPLPLAGFIFHVSRCGSTLVSQVLAASPRHRVISEAAPVDAALRSGGPDVPAATRVAWLRTTLGLLGQRGDDREACTFVKFDAWSVLHLPLIRAAFPDVPLLMLVRAPDEVVVSHLRQPGAMTVPGVVGLTPTGIDPAMAWAVPREEYIARVLGDFCKAALAGLDDAARVVDHADLPAAIAEHVLPHFGVHPTEEEQQLMASASLRDSKRPYQAFTPDATAKQEMADSRVREAVAQWVEPSYRLLRARR